MPLPRRRFLAASVPAVPLAGALRAAPAASPSSATLRAGDLTAVVGDNTSSGTHRAGYNGVWSLHHAQGPRSLFVPALSGLNLEHIVTGEHLEARETFFEPRHAPMTLRVTGPAEAELHQPPTPTFHVESWSRFRVSAPHVLDFEFRCRAHRDVFPYGSLALFWASYIHAPADKSLYFLGGSDGQSQLWTQFCPQWHNDQSTVRHRADDFTLRFPDGGRDALFKNLSRLRFDLPFFYGRFEGLVWIVMFDRTEGIRFTQSPSGGGVDPAFRTTNPAWDFQFVIRDPKPLQDYGFRVRTILCPEIPRDEILARFVRWQEDSR
jgi:hypothetical protein